MINPHVLIIHKHPYLFSILYEIKSILNFEIEELNTNNISKSHVDKNFIVVSGDENFETINKLKINNYPINIYKLIEIINVQFLKNKFNQQNNIQIGKYYINLNSRKMSKNEKFLSLTEKETKIINFLIKSKKAATISNLQTEVWGHKSKLDTHTVETHVYRLRKKVEKQFDDKSFIISLKNGYKIQS